MDDLRTARTALESAARGFDPSACTGDDAIAVVEEIGAIRRLADGVLGKAAKRVEDTAAYTYKNDRNAAELCARVTGVSSGEAKRAIEVAAKLECLPATDAAVRAGRLLARAVELIVGEAAENPAAEPGLLAAAGQGMVPLRDACIAKRARREDEAARAKRQHAARSFRIWPAPDGMVEGHFKVTPEVGGAIKAVIDHGTGKQFRAARTSGVHESQDAYAADAFVDAMVGDPAGKPAKAGGWSAHVLIDHEALVRGHTIEGETCEIPGVGPVSVEWVRELLGTAFVTAIDQEGQRHHDRGALRPAHPRRAAHRDDRLRSGVLDRRLLRARVPRARSLRDRPRQRRPDRPVEPRLALLHPPHPKNPGLDPRPTRPDHRQTKTHPTPNRATTPQSSPPDGRVRIVWNAARASRTAYTRSHCLNQYASSEHPNDAQGRHPGGRGVS